MSGCACVRSAAPVDSCPYTVSRNGRIAALQPCRNSEARWRRRQPSVGRPRALPLSLPCRNERRRTAANVTYRVQSKDESAPLIHVSAPGASWLASAGASRPSSQRRSMWRPQRRTANTIDGRFAKSAASAAAVSERGTATATARHGTHLCLRQRFVSTAQLSNSRRPCSRTTVLRYLIQTMRRQ